MTSHDDSDGKPLPPIKLSEFPPEVANVLREHIGEGDELIISTRHSNSHHLSTLPDRETLTTIENAAPGSIQKLVDAEATYARTAELNAKNDGKVIAWRGTIMFFFSTLAFLFQIAMVASGLYLLIEVAPEHKSPEIIYTVSLALVGAGIGGRIKKLILNTD